MFGRVVLGLAYASSARRRRSDVGGSILTRLDRLSAVALRRIGLSRKVPVIVRNDTVVPQAHGILRPIIVLPAHAATWSDERLLAVVLHEMAHIKRRDHITWPIVNAAVSWLWFNPLIWAALAKMRRESEKACDDYVLRTGTTGISYAEHLYDLCRNLRSSTKLAPAVLMLGRRNELEERIMYIFQSRSDRRPMNLRKRMLVAMLMALTVVPVVGVNGFKTDAVLTDVSPGERDGIMATLAEFYSELSRGSDYESVRERFLTSDYFDNPDLTLENLTEAVKRVAFDNTISLLSRSGVSPAKEVHGRVMSIHRESDEYIVAQHLNVIAERVTGVTVTENEYGELITKRDPSSTEEPKLDSCRLVNSLAHQIRFRKEDGLWKISRFDDGVALMRMDTDNPYGPIFLFWMEEIDEQTTPFGPGIFKIFPSDIVCCASNTKFVLENH